MSVEWRAAIGGRIFNGWTEPGFDVTGVHWRTSGKVKARAKANVHVHRVAPPVGRIAVEEN